MTPNQNQRRQWSDPATVAGWEKREQLTERVSKHVLAAAQLHPGESVLEVGAGGGKLALLAARAVTASGRITGADISPGMVDLARSRARAARAKQVTFTVADCQCDTIAGGPFDIAISQFGVMFFDDPVAAFRNIRDHLKRGARLAFACWQPAARNAWFPGPVLAPFRDGAPPAAEQGPLPGPFSFADPAYVRAVLQQAGFMGIDRSAKTVTVRVPRDTIVDDSMPGLLNVRPGAAAAALAAIDAHIAPMRVPGSDLYRFELRIQVFTANAQG